MKYHNPTYIFSSFPCNVSGCWFFFKKCSNQSKEIFRKKRTRKSQTFYLDTEGKSDTDEHFCLNRVSEMKQQCGKGADFAVIYGPTGNLSMFLWVINRTRKTV